MARLVRLVPAALGVAILAALALVLADHAQTAEKPFQPVHARLDRTPADDPDLQAFVARLRTAVAAGDIGWIDGALSSRFAVVTCTGSALDPCAPGQTNTRAAAGRTPAERLRAGLGSTAPVDTDSDMDPDEAADVPPPATPAAPAASAPATAPPPAASDPAPAPATDDEAAIKKAPPRTPEDVVIGQLAGMIDGDPGTHPDVRGIACLPAWPIFDRVAAKRIVTGDDIDDDNLRIASNPAPLHAAPKPESETIATLAVGDLVPVLNDAIDDLPPGWNAVGLPDGRLGYTDDLALDELDPVGPCFVKENGAWKIAFVVLRNR